MDENELYALLKESEGAGISSTRFGNKPMFWKSAKGCFIYNYSGIKYLDCTSSYGVMGIGYSNQDVSNSIINTVSNITHTMCEIYPTEPYVIALDSIRKAIGRNQDQVVLTGTGSDAVDVAMKLAYRYTRKTGVIAFKDSFHGQTLNSLNYTGLSTFREPFASILPRNVVFLPYPNTYRNQFASDEELLNESIKLIENTVLMQKGKDNEIGAILVEPMQNAAGYIMPPKGFLRELRRICNDYSLLLVTDEIFTGFGRCGKWLMQEYEGIKADIVCVGKAMTGGMPAAACVASKEIMEALDYEGLVPLHGSTFTGNAIICSAISTTISVLKSQNLIERSEQNGEYLRKRLRNIFQSIEIVGSIRGSGSAIIIEFVNNKKDKSRNPEAASDFANYLFKQGIISLISGLPYCNCVALCVPYIISKEELNIILNACDMYVKNLSICRE